MTADMFNTPTRTMSGFVDLDSVLDIKVTDIITPADLYSKTVRKIINFINLITGKNYISWEQVQSQVFYYYNDITKQHARVVLKYYRHNDYYVAEIRTGQRKRQANPLIDFVDLEAPPIVDPPIYM